MPLESRRRLNLRIANGKGTLDDRPVATIRYAAANILRAASQDRQDEENRAKEYGNPGNSPCCIPWRTKDSQDNAQ